VTSRSPLVSCLIPVRDGARFLEEAIDSALGQSHRPIEVIVSDDGSRDGTPDIARAYGPAVVYVPGPAAGAPAARNRGIRAARGELVAFLDADDRWHPGKLALQVACFVRNPALALCLAQARPVWAAELVETRSRVERERLAVIVTACHLSTAVARRALIDAVGVFDETRPLGDDTEWFQRVINAGVPVEILPDVLVDRRLHPGSLTYGTNVFTREDLLAHVRELVAGRRRTPGSQSRPS
jgi:glycosyltransferase involved in cell wall biosynthesis